MNTAFQLFFTEFGEEYYESPRNTRRIELLPLDEYDLVIASVSGGKDSLAEVLFLLEQGVPPHKIELHHQSIDGEPGTAEPFMDWACTENYVKAMGEAFGMKVRFQWREGGFKNELLRENRMSLGVGFENEGELFHLPTLNGKISTRKRWPAKSPNLSVRWCSSSLKISVFERAINNYPDLKGDLLNQLKVLVLTGERREESAARSKYAETELHPCSTRSRLVHWWRPVIDFTEEQVWDLIEKYRITPHPAYILGWNRTSCFGCIFSSPDLWAMMREIAPDRFDNLVRMEKELNFTVDAKHSLEEMAAIGSINRLPKEWRTSKYVKMALEGHFTVDDFFTEKWELPAGAFRGSVGGSI